MKSSSGNQTLARVRSLVIIRVERVQVASALASLRAQNGRCHPTRLDFLLDASRLFAAVRRLKRAERAASERDGGGRSKLLAATLLSDTAARARAREHVRRCRDY